MIAAEINAVTILRDVIAAVSSTLTPAAMV